MGLNNLAYLHWSFVVAVAVSVLCPNLLCYCYRPSEVLTVAHVMIQWVQVQARTSLRPCFCCEFLLTLPRLRALTHRLIAVGSAALSPGCNSTLCFQEGRDRWYFTMKLGILLRVFRDPLGLCFGFISRSSVQGCRAGIPARRCWNLCLFGVFAFGK